MIEWPLWLSECKIMKNLHAHYKITYSYTVPRRAASAQSYIAIDSK